MKKTDKIDYNFNLYRLIFDDKCVRKYIYHEYGDDSPFSKEYMIAYLKLKILIKQQKENKMLKLPDKKYEPKHNYELNKYARGWNSIIEGAECLCKAFGDEHTKKYILECKEDNLKRAEIPLFKGAYDCIVEIEKLNAEDAEAKDVFDEFSDSLNMLNNLTIRRSLYRISSWQKIIEQLMHQEEMQQEKLKKVSKI